ncbi:MAG: hypothetical protein RLZ98_414 [Pseudomonadota bacterium]|jgi:UPF0716 protein FxsA
MRLGLLLLFVAIPLIELALLIKVGQTIGLWPTIAIVIGTAIAGSMVLHRQGWQVMQRAMEASARGQPPIEPVIDGSFLLVAGGLLLAPGLITDAVGLALLVPGVRRWVARAIFRMIISRADVRVDIRTGHAGAGERDSNDERRSRSGPIIEGEYETLDEPKEGPDRDRRDKRQ